MAAIAPTRMWAVTKRGAGGGRFGRDDGSWAQERFARGADDALGGGGGVGEGGQVAHLAGGAGVELSVEMQLDLGVGAGGGPVGNTVGCGLPEVAQQVG